MSSQQALKVIIFEDEILLANDLRMQIEPYGFKVLSIFRKAEEGLAWLEDQARDGVVFDVILMDITLAGKMNGIEAAGLIMENFGCAIVFITGMSQLNVFDEAFSARPHAFLVKPFDLNQAIVSIRLAVYQNRLEKELIRHQSDLEEIIRERTLELVEARINTENAIRQRNAILRSVLTQLEEPVKGISAEIATLRNSSGDNPEKNHAIVSIDQYLSRMEDLFRQIPAANGIP